MSNSKQGLEEEKRRMKRLTEEQKKRLSIDDKFKYADMLCKRLDILKLGSAQDLERLDRKINKFLMQATARKM